MSNDKINEINLILVDFYINITWLELIPKMNKKSVSTRGFTKWLDYSRFTP